MKRSGFSATSLRNQVQVWAYICWSLPATVTLGRICGSMIVNLLLGRIGLQIKLGHMVLIYAASLQQQKDAVRNFKSSVALHTA